jgi:hypothetical protein
VIYILFALVLFVFSHASLRYKKLRRQAYYPVLLALFVFAAFRFQVGCDWSGYYYQCVAAEDVSEDLIAKLNEPIWWLIMNLIKSQGFSYPVINIVSSAIFFYGVHVLARRQPDPLAFLVFLLPILIINMPMSGIRQGAAIGLICIAFAAFIDRRPLRFVLWVLIAGGFHTSALVFLILAPLATGRYSKERLTAAAIIAIPGLLFLAGGISAGVAATRYIGNGIDASGAIVRVGAIFLTAVYYYYFLRKKWERNFSRDFSLVSIGAMGMTFAMLLLLVSSVIADRFAYYLIPIQAVMFARLPFIQFRSGKWLHVALPYVALMTMLVGWTQTSSLFEQCYLPYQSWIFGMPAGDILKEGVFE